MDHTSRNTDAKYHKSFPGGSVIICLPMQETRVWSPGQEDALEEEMASHSRILAREIPWIQELGGLQSTGSQESDHDLLIKQQKYHKFQNEESCPM